MKSPILLIAMLICSSCTYYEDDDYNVTNSYNHYGESNDSTKCTNNDKSNNKNTGTISFGVTDVSEGS